MSTRTDHELFPVRREPRNVWERTGLDPRQERRLNAVMLALIFIITGGWIFSAAHAIRYGEAPDVARRIAAGGMPLSARSAPDATFLMDAALRRFTDYTDWRGESGEVRVVLQYPGEEVPLPADVPEEMEIVYQRVEGGVDTVAVPAAGGAPPPEPGIWNMVLRARGRCAAPPHRSPTSTSSPPFPPLNSERAGSANTGSEAGPRADWSVRGAAGFVRSRPRT
jgi:hypothetical protein